MKVTFNILDKILLILVALSFSLLMVIQFLSYNNNQISINVSWFDKDYNSFFSENEKPDKGIIILKNLSPSYEDIGILVNGEKIASFTGKNEVKIHVHHNDIVEIDGTKYNNNVSVQVVGVSKNIERPMLDDYVTTSHSIEILCKVQIK